MEQEIFRKVSIVHKIANSSEKRKTIQVSEVNESVSKIARLFKSKEKTIKEIKQSLKEANKNMVSATIMTTEAIEKNENMLERIKALESFLHRSADEDDDSKKKLSTLTETLRSLNETKLQQIQLTSEQAVGMRLVHHLIASSEVTEMAIRTTFLKLKEIHTQQENILARKKVI